MRWLLGRETLTSPIPCPVFCFTEVCGRAPFQRPREQLQLSDSQPKSKSKSLDIDLPELPRLKHKLQQVEWLEEVEETLEGSVTVDCVRKLLDSGTSMAPHPKIEKAMAQLQQLLTNMETWEEKASQALNAK